MNKDIENQMDLMIRRMNQVNEKEFWMNRDTFMMLFPDKPTESYNGIPIKIDKFMRDEDVLLKPKL